MKGKKGIILIALLLILGSLVVWQFFLKDKDKGKSKKPKKAKPAVEQKVQEAPKPSPEVPAQPEPEAPSEAPAETPEEKPETPPSAEVSPEQTESGEQVPRAQSATPQGQIQIEVGEAIRIAEGSTFFLTQPKATSTTNRPLKYQWELLSGPDDKLKMAAQDQLQARVTIGNLAQPQEFVLRLKVSDGQVEVTEDLTITGYPAKLKVVAQGGGAFLGVQALGTQWVAARERQLDIYSPELKLVQNIPLEFVVTQFFTSASNIYAQDPEGSWTLVQYDPVGGVQSSRLTMMGKKIRHAFPVTLEGQPYAFALLEKQVELWNLSDARKPKLKSSMPTQLKDPRFLAFQGRHLYVADEQSIEIMEFSTGKPVASVPAGGSITALKTYSLDGSHFLLSAIGRDRTSQNRQDYGVRLFQLREDGRFGEEKKVTIEGAPVAGAVVLPQGKGALLKVWEKEKLTLKVLDLKNQKLLPLQLKQNNFMELTDLVPSSNSQDLMVMAADGNQLRALALQPGAEGYGVQEKGSVPTIFSAVWVASPGNGDKLWVGDEGTQAGGALAVADASSLQILKTTNAQGLHPIAGDFHASEQTGLLLYIPDQGEGELGLVPIASQTVLRSSPILGGKGPQGELKPLDIAGYSDEAGLRVAVALARFQGTVVGSGLGLWQKPAQQTNEAFLKSDLKKAMTLIALQDARGVALTPDGKGAMVAAGDQGVIAVDLAKQQAVTRMTLGAGDWVADRVLVAHGGQMVLASFIQKTSGQVIVKIFGLQEEFKMQEYATLTGLKAVKTSAGLRAPQLALTQDDLYLVAPLEGNRLAIFNLSYPAEPFSIIETTLSGEIRGVSLANQFKDIFVALGRGGIVKLEFGF